MLLALGVGETELKLTRSLRLAPWKAETGLGAANCVADVVDVVASGGGKACIDGFMEDCGAGVADWNSSKSSSPALLDCIALKSSIAFGTDFFPFEKSSFGGVSGGTSSSSNPRISISGSFFFGISSCFVSRFTGDDETSVLRRVGDFVAPSSNSSYSSNRSLRVESWNPEVFPPNPPPSPKTPPL